MMEYYWMWLNKVAATKECHIKAHTKKTCNLVFKIKITGWNFLKKFYSRRKSLPQIHPTKKNYQKL